MSAIGFQRRLIYDHTVVVVNSTSYDHVDKLSGLLKFANYIDTLYLLVKSTRRDCHVSAYK